SAPTDSTASAVAKNVNGVVTTSSPGPMPSARSASTSASVPEFTPTAWRTPRYSATSRSNASTSGPRMNWPERRTRCTAALTSSQSASISGERSSTGIMWDAERWTDEGSRPAFFGKLAERAVGEAVAEAGAGARHHAVGVGRAETVAVAAHPADLPRWRADDERVVRHVPRDHGPGRDEAV